MRPVVRSFRLFFVFVFAATQAWAGSAAARPGTLASLKQMTLEELMAVQVNSVSGLEEAYREAAAALTVVTGEHLRRSGATSVPEALRWVPGMFVARRDASTWAVSARGFSSINSEKLLVLSDTRSIYTPLFSGVAWDVQDYLMSDIDRIEVIRGPGATLWGSNAVNGVINITTKHAADTHGTHLEASAGTDQRVMIGARHGAETAGGVHYRVFGKFFERGDTSHANSNSDAAKLAHLGFRADWKPQPNDEFTVQGDIYRGRTGQLAPAVTIIGRPGPTGPLETDVAGGNVLARWRHWFASDADLQVRFYFDQTHRNDPSFTDDLDTFDLDVRHRFVPRPRHQMIWGLNYRLTSNRNEGKGVFAVQPPASDDQLVSGFVQDQFALRDDLRVTFGTKLEHNDFSGTEVQPSVRGVWDWRRGHTLWGAISRAARIPTRLERDIFIDASDPAGDPVVRLLGNRDFAAEELLAYELGYRWRMIEDLLVDVSVFDNHYDGLASLELGDPFAEPGSGRTIIPVMSRNLTEGRARGVETRVTFTPLRQWRLGVTHSYFHLDLNPLGQDANRGVFYEGSTPRHQFMLSSFLTLPGAVELDMHLRRIGAVKRFPEDVSGGGIPAYTELDVALSWHLSLNTRLSLVGQNLLHDEHLEFGSPAARGAIERAVYLKTVWDF